MKLRVRKWRKNSAADGSSVCLHAPNVLIQTDQTEPFVFVDEQTQRPSV